MEFRFVESAVFTRRITRMGLESELRELQLELLKNPHAGDLDPGTGGLRKVRMPDSRRGKGKRSGARVHYLFLPHANLICFAFAYGKDESDSLTAEQKKAVRAMADMMKREHR